MLPIRCGAGSANTSALISLEVSMNQTAPVLPSYEVPVLEALFDLDPTLDPLVFAAIEEVLRARFNLVFYQFFTLLLKTVQPWAVPAVTGAAKAGAIALSGVSGIITTEALGTAAGAIYTLEFTNSAIDESSNLLIAATNGTNTGGTPALQSVVVGNGVATVVIRNIGAVAFNGTLQLNFILR
jgi:hypothetical protein